MGEGRLWERLRIYSGKYLFNKSKFYLEKFLILQLHVHVLFRNYKMDDNSMPRKQARLDTFLIPRRDEKS